MSPASNRTPDVSIENHGSIMLFRLLTPAATDFVDENVSGEAQFFHGALVVEPRYAQDLAEGMIEAGLAVL